jgi:hypothetical protein
MLNSAGFNLLAATAPETLINPPTKAPLPSAPYRNRRSVRHGAIDSVTNLFLIPSSRPPGFDFELLLLSLLLIDRDVGSTTLFNVDNFLIEDTDVGVNESVGVNAHPNLAQQHSKTTHIAHIVVIWEKSRDTFIIRRSLTH